MSEIDFAGEARELWAFYWARIHNLYERQGRPIVKMSQAPDDTPAIHHAESALRSIAQRVQEEIVELKRALGMAYPLAVRLKILALVPDNFDEAHKLRGKLVQIIFDALTRNVGLSESEVHAYTDLLNQTNNPEAAEIGILKERIRILGDSMERMDEFHKKAMQDVVAEVRKEEAVQCIKAYDEIRADERAKVFASLGHDNSLGHVKPSMWLDALLNAARDSERRKWAERMEKQSGIEASWHEISSAITLKEWAKRLRENSDG